MPSRLYQEGFDAILQGKPCSDTQYNLDRRSKPSQRRGNQVWVEDKRVKSGGYWRNLPKGAGATDKPSSSAAGRGGVLKATALVAGGVAVGAIAGVLAAKQWSSPKDIGAKVSDARKSAQKKADKEVEQVRRELSDKHEKEMAAAGSQLEQAKKEFEGQKESAISQGIQERKQQLQTEFLKRTRASQQQMDADLEKRTQEIHERVNREAMDQILAERESAMKAAQEEIRTKTEPKAVRSGAIADDDQKGISLGASVRQGLDLNTVGAQNMQRRIADATKRLVGRQSEQVMQDMNAEFKQQMQAVHKMHTDQVPKSRKQAENQMNIRWEAMNTALTRQGQRETNLAVQSDELRKRATSSYHQAFQELSLKAAGRGAYDQDLIEDFDAKSVRINASIQQEMTKIAQAVKQKDRLDQPFLGRMDSPTAFFSSTQAPLPPGLNPQIALTLKRVIEDVYVSGIQRVLSYQMDADRSISGKFFADRQVYDFTLSPDNKLTYIESKNESKNRADSSREEFLAVLRSDKQGGVGQKKCETGKPCGPNACISKSYKCSKKLGIKAAALAGQVRSSLPPALLQTLAPAAVGVLAAGAIAAIAAKTSTSHGEDPEGYANELTPHQNQYYDSSFPSDEEFAKARLEPVEPVISGESVTGVHKRYKTKVGDREFFVKAESEAGVSKEIASFEIAKAVGLGDHVLPARRIYHLDKPHVVNPLLTKDDVQSLSSDKKLRKFVQQMPSDKVADFVLFDYATHNHDRHSGNFLIQKSGDVLLIDHGAVKWDAPNTVSTKLETEKNFFFKHGMGSDPETEIPENSLRNFVENRDKVRQVMAYRYAGQPRSFVDPVMDRLDQRFDVMESMLSNGDRRVKHLIRGQPVPTKQQTEVFDKNPQEGKFVNGIALQSSDPNYYKTVADNKSFKEPPWSKDLKDSQKKSGTIVVEPDGRLWIYEPAGHYAGTKNTFAKGGVEPELTPQQSAIKETREELGLQVKIIDHLGDFSHKTGDRVKPGEKPPAVIRHYVAVRTGGAPWDAHWEADKVKLATPDDAGKLFNKSRDKKILDAVGQYTSSASGAGKIQSAYDEERKAKQKPWSPSMSKKDAEQWASQSAYRQETYHATSSEAEDPIKKGGFQLSFRKVGRAYGNGVYVGLDAKSVEPYRQMAKPQGVTLTTRVNVKKVLDIDREKRAIQGNGFPSRKLLQAGDAMRPIAKNIGQGDNFDRMVKHIKKENVRLKDQLSRGKITQDQYNQQYADRPDSEAFSFVAQQAGYEAIKVTGGRKKIGMLVVFNPKNVTVLDEKNG